LEPSQLSFGRAAPTIPVSNIDEALGFYRDVLGMEVTFTNGEPTGFVIMQRDRAEIHLTLVRGHKGGAWNVAHLIVSDAIALRDRCVERGARIVKGLRDHEYGMRAFVVADPDGNRIDVGENLDE
jgi:catechol 2,3-dioxygenase-like lactoylglutathione lyase family enzyme